MRAGKRRQSHAKADTQVQAKTTSAPHSKQTQSSHNQQWSQMIFGSCTRATKPLRIQAKNTRNDASTSTQGSVQRMCDDCEEEKLTSADNGNIQTKLTLGASDSPHEQEADDVAHRVMRQPTTGGNDDELEIQRLSLSPVQRLCMDCGDESVGGSIVQKHSNSASPGGSAPASVHQAVNQAGSGSPVAPAVKDRVEPVLNADLSNVQVHSGAYAQEAARDINAKAFTHKDHIYLGEGQSANDVELMAHELTHTQQQTQRIARKENLIQRQEGSGAKGCGDLKEGFTTTKIVKKLKQTDLRLKQPKLYYAHPTGLDKDLVKRSGNIKLGPNTGDILRVGKTSTYGWTPTCYSPGGDKSDRIYWLYYKYLKTFPPPPEKKTKQDKTANKKHSSKSKPKVYNSYPELESQSEGALARRYAEQCNFTVTNSKNQDPVAKATGENPCRVDDLRTSAILVDKFIKSFLDATVDMGKHLLKVARKEVKLLKETFTDSTSAQALYDASDLLLTTFAGGKIDGNKMNSSHYGGDGAEAERIYSEQEQSTIDNEIAMLAQLNPVFNDPEFINDMKKMANDGTDHSLKDFQGAGLRACDRKLSSIKDVWSEIGSDRNVIFKIPNLMHYTRQNLRIDDKSVRNTILVQYKKLYGKDPSDTLFKLLGLAFAAIGFIPHPIAKAVGAVGGAAVSAAEVHTEYYDYLFTKNLRNVSFTDASLLASEDPDLLWLAVAVLELLVDAGDVFDILKGSAKAFSKSGDMKKFREAVNNSKAGPAVKRNVLKKAQVEKKMIKAEAKVIDDAVKLPKKKAAQALAAPVNKNLPKNIKQTKISDEIGVLHETPLPGNHKAIRKATNTWCVRSTEVCGVPVEDEIEHSFDKNFMKTFMDTKAPKGKYRKAPRLESNPKTKLGKDARDEFRNVRESYVDMLHVKKGEDIHHAIELQVLDRYPGVFTSKQLNDFKNMRGIPKELKLNKYDEAIGIRKQLHNHYIRWRWNEYYADLDKKIIEQGLEHGTEAYKTFVKAYLIDARDTLDYVVGQLFTEFARGVKKAPK